MNHRKCLNWENWQWEGYARPSELVLKEYVSQEEREVELVSPGEAQQGGVLLVRVPK